MAPVQTLNCLSILDASSVHGMAGQVCTRRPAKPCRVPAYDCCDSEDPGN
jgi:hypothetical protein